MGLTKTDIRFIVNLVLDVLKSVAEYTDAEWDNSLVPLLEWIADNWVESWLDDAPEKIVAAMPQALTVNDIADILPDIISLVQHLIKLFRKRSKS